MATGIVPPGWPQDLPPPASPEFEVKVVGWLLDRGPDGLREQDVLRRYPLALATLVTRHQKATLEGLRGSYSNARRELGDRLPPHELGLVLAAIESSGAEASETSRQVELVLDALSGRQWRDRL
ncbi:MAG: hypothetical protein U0990_10120 [Candidatus Nanopelagicales bacterium]|nr:hypothetical protein [Candidatus Nanopelagicales bacterium]MDZ4250433.1 hypothetical protein [Candidatus Nanopelagicales bacterium]